MVHQSGSRVLVCIDGIVDVCYEVVHTAVEGREKSDVVEGDMHRKSVVAHMAIVDGVQVEDGVAL